jgi:Lon protease-like protein
MFPLENGLVPMALLPLRIFEPRYLEMFEGLDVDDEFGVVLIERGSEVGGEDLRFSTGCVARVLDCRVDERGIKHVLARGTHRIRIEEWLVDDPYPEAIVVDLEDEPLDDAEGHARLRSLTGQAIELVAELGYEVENLTPHLSEDLRVGVYQALAQVPLSTLDRHRILEEATTARRLAATIEAVESFVELARLQLGHAP